MPRRERGGDEGWESERKGRTENMVLGMVIHLLAFTYRVVML